jgi:hypothetical protein
MVDTRCEVCLQPATKKCTGCGKVFCDLHVRYGSQGGGMYGGGGDVGYYCDACWERRGKGRKRLAFIVLALGLVLLGMNLLGVFVARGALPADTDRVAGASPLAVSWPMMGVVILILLLVFGFVAMRRR